MFAKANNYQKNFWSLVAAPQNIFFLNIIGSFLVITVQKQKNNVYKSKNNCSREKILLKRKTT